MGFPYKQIFEKSEETLLAYGSKHMAVEEIQANLDEFKTYEHRRLSDDDYFSIMIAIIFYSGFKAAIVTAKMEVIKRHFPSWEIVAGYTQQDISSILSDSKMIRNRRKIEACAYNAKLFDSIVSKHGSFQNYIDSFKPYDSFENLMLLKGDLKNRFQYLGKVTVYHFLTDMGFPVIKPDRVICRIFYRLGVIDDEDQLLDTVIQGRNFAEAVGKPIRYIDIVFVAYGQAQSLEFGIDQGICLKQPRCQFCGLTELCRYYMAIKA